MSTTDPGRTAPAPVGSRPVGSTGQQAPVRPSPADPPRPVETGRTAQPGQARPAQPGRPAQTGPNPVQTGANGRILPPPPGAARPAQPRPGQARPAQPGQPRPGQARAPRPGQPVAGPARGGRPGVRRGPRKARLSLARVDPWSVFKLSLLLAVALGIIGVVVTAVVWNVVNGMGVFSDVNSLVGQVQGDQNAFDIYDYVGFERMLSLSVVVSAVNVLIITALSTLFAFVYNISSGLVGGLHVTLTDE